jgi:hypothetical protein
MGSTMAPPGKRCPVSGEERNNGASRNYHRWIRHQFSVPQSPTSMPTFCEGGFIATRRPAFEAATQFRRKVNGGTRPRRLTRTAVP